MKTSFAILAVLLTSALVAGGAYADSGTAGAPRTTSLNGAEETPAGDPDGTGSAWVTLNVGKGRVCWSLTWASIDPPTAAHIHRAPAGTAGGVVVPFFTAAPAVASGCREGVDPVLIQDIIDFPEKYYVNVHNPAFPAGAIRGQLSVPGQAD